MVSLGRRLMGGMIVKKIFVALVGALGCLNGAVGAYFSFVLLDSFLRAQNFIFLGFFFTFLFFFCSSVGSDIAFWVFYLV